ncbi:hypothetical protein GGR51DRAFT_279771 [Nemania sp. FL0031]|nr:hypothetical protein GGR51DRAFT_279771 [Nemania sp. FL0031]
MEYPHYFRLCLVEAKWIVLRILTAYTVSDHDACTQRYLSRNHGGGDIGRSLYGYSASAYRTPRICLSATYDISRDLLYHLAASFTYPQSLLYRTYSKFAHVRIIGSNIIQIRLEWNYESDIPAYTIAVPRPHKPPLIIFNQTSQCASKTRLIIDLLITINAQVLETISHMILACKAKSHKLAVKAHSYRYSTMMPDLDASNSSQWPDHTGPRQLSYNLETDVYSWAQEFLDDLPQFDLQPSPLLPPELFGTQSSRRGSLSGITNPDEEYSCHRAKRQRREDTDQRNPERNSSETDAFLPTNAQNRTNSPLLSTAVPSSNKFACPFSKHDRKVHRNIKDWKCCLGPGPGWEINRLKEHLYRKHSAKYQCPRCLDEFEDDSKLHQHYRSPTPCPINNNGPGTGRIGAHEVNQLKKKSRGLSDEEKWKNMYRIIFRLESTADIPSPYFEDITQVPNTGPSGSSDEDSLPQFLCYLQDCLREGDETQQSPATIQACIGLVQDYRRLEGRKKWTHTPTGNITRRIG